MPENSPASNNQYPGRAISPEETQMLFGVANDIASVYSSMAGVDVTLNLGVHQALDKRVTEHCDQYFAKATERGAPPEAQLMVVALAAGSMQGYHKAQAEINKLAVSGQVSPLVISTLEAFESQRDSLRAQQPMSVYQDEYDTAWQLRDAQMVPEGSMDKLVLTAFATGVAATHQGRDDLYQTTQASLQAQLST